MIKSTGDIPLCLLGFTVVITVLREVRPSVLRRNHVPCGARIVDSLRTLILIDIRNRNRTGHAAGITPQPIQLIRNSRSIHPVVGSRIDLRAEHIGILDRPLDRLGSSRTRSRSSYGFPILTLGAGCERITRQSGRTDERILTAPLVKQTERIGVTRIVIGSTEVAVHHFR